MVSEQSRHGAAKKRRHDDERTNEPNGMTQMTKNLNEAEPGRLADNSLPDSDLDTDSALTTQSSKEKKTKKSEGLPFPSVSTDSVAEREPEAEKRKKQKNNGLQAPEWSTDSVMETESIDTESEKVKKKKKKKAKNKDGLSLKSDSITSVMTVQPEKEKSQHDRLQFLVSVIEMEAEKEEKRRKKDDDDDDVQIQELDTDLATTTQPEKEKNDDLQVPALHTDSVLEMQPKNKEEKNDSLQSPELESAPVLEMELKKKKKRKKNDVLQGPDLETNSFIEPEAKKEKKKKKKNAGLQVPELETDLVVKIEPMEEKKRKAQSVFEFDSEDFTGGGESGRSSSDATITASQSPERNGGMKGSRRSSLGMRTGDDAVGSPGMSTGDQDADHAEDTQGHPPRKGPKVKKKVRFQEPVEKEEVSDEKVMHATAEKDFEDSDFENSAKVPDDETMNATAAKDFENIGVRSWKLDFLRDDLRYGRFNKEEDDKIREAVGNYIKSRGWSTEEGLSNILRPAGAGLRGCWLEIAKCLPNRPVKQVNARGIRLFERSKRGRWSQEEIAMIKKLHETHGRQWSKISEVLGRSGERCKDMMRRLRLEGIRTTGTWSQEEFDKLCKLVRRCLVVKASTPSEGRKSRRELHDDINWDWVADEMRRDGVRCCEAWYKKLASPLVVDKNWAHVDDQFLLHSLFEMGASSEEAVDWDNVLDHRDGVYCMRRFNEMKRFLGWPQPDSFEDMLEMLAKRYSPYLVGAEEEDDLLETLEAAK